MTSSPHAQQCYLTMLLPQQLHGPLHYQDTIESIRVLKGARVW